MKMKKILIIMLPALLAGCSTYETFYQNFVNRVNTDSMTYQCDEQALDVALNDKKQEVSFTLDDKPLTLKQGISASGTRYSDGIYVFWSKGDEATVYRQDRIVLHNCKLAGSH
ncbi:lysozyme inhibitor [Salmonella enterica subsp. enterica serovar Choleraesuis]|nr:lysozyme inhibitor [Salmonella enterica subsp. enterica serovar Choleraesuis]